MAYKHEDSEKQGLLIEERRPTPPPRRRLLRFSYGVFIIAFLFAWWNYNAIPRGSTWNESERSSEENDAVVDFADITPSQKLEWHSCYGRMKCARLTVPMDYHRPLNASHENPKVHIALLLVPGKHGPRNFSTSPILLNPGGPGGSGVMMALGWAHRLQEILGEDRDLIGFDPRGVGATTPRADCYSYPKKGIAPGDGSDLESEDYARGSYHRFLWTLQGKEVGLVNSTSDSLRKLDVRARTVAKLCQEKDSLHGRDSIFKYAHTPSVATDMLTIVDAWDEWTATLNEVPAEEPKAAGDLSFEEETETQSALHASEHLPNLDTKGKLVYWGFSYGTLLGATFASMFPDRVGRIILDGVVDADLYVSPMWSESLLDADKAMHSFFNYCAEAKEQCALYRKGDSATDVQSRFKEVLDRYKNNPVTLIDLQTKSPFVLDLNDLRQLLFQALYSPIQMFPSLSFVFDILYRQDLDILKKTFALPPVFDLDPVCNMVLPAMVYPTEAQYTIMCSDKRYVLNETIPNLQARFENMSKTSTFADIWMTLLMGCDAWGIKAVDPPMRWDDHPAHKQKPIKTSFPVLFISNSADPVTPLKAGVKMAKKFVNAGLIEQISEGHCSVAAVSLCTINKVRAYFNEGKVPPPPVEGKKGKELTDGKWDRCEADEKPFQPYNALEWVDARGPEASADAKRMTAYQELRFLSEDLPFWGMGNLPQGSRLIDQQ